MKWHLFDFVVWLSAVLLLPFCSAQLGGNIDYNNPLVQTNYGPVRGAPYQLSGVNSGVTRNYRIVAFIGVPYARPPTGVNRLQPPQPPVIWSDPLDCTGTRKVMCMQVEQRFTWSNTQGIAEDEDCLHLNIYVPVERPTAAIPVLVYFHGGEFKYGGKDLFKPDYLFNSVLPTNTYGMIIVTVNYRLGVLGFLSTDDINQPGNNGIRDQVLALQWVNENIAKFNGNPQNVTIMGHDAGAVSVSMHMLNPGSWKYFSSAISVSGTVFSPWAFKDVPVEQARKFGYNFGCDWRTDRLVECLRYQDANALMRTARDARDWEQNIDPYWFRPVVDKNVTSSALLTDFPLILYKRGAVKKAPYMLIGTSQEGTLEFYLQYDKVQQKTLLEEKIAFLIRPYLKTYARESIMSSAFAFKYFNRTHRSSYSGGNAGLFALTGNQFANQAGIRPGNNYNYLNALGTDGRPGSGIQYSSVDGYTELEANQIFSQMLGDFMYLGPLDYVARYHSQQADTVMVIFDYLGLTKSFGPLQIKAYKASRDTYGVTHLHDVWYSWPNDYEQTALTGNDNIFSNTYSKYLCDFVLLNNAPRNSLRYTPSSPNYNYFGRQTVQTVVPISAQNGNGYRTDYMDFINNYIYALQDESAYYPPWFPTESYKAYQEATWSLVGVLILLVIVVVMIGAYLYLRNRDSGTGDVHLKRKRQEEDPLNN